MFKKCIHGYYRLSNGCIKTLLHFSVLQTHRLAETGAERQGVNRGLEEGDFLFGNRFSRLRGTFPKMKVYIRGPYFCAPNAFIRANASVTHDHSEPVTKQTFKMIIQK